MATAVGWLSGDHHERTGASAAFIVSVADLLSEGAPLSTAPAVVLTVLAGARRVGPAHCKLHLVYRGQRSFNLSDVCKIC